MSGLILSINSSTKNVCLALYSNTPNSHKQRIKLNNNSSQTDATFETAFGKDVGFIQVCLDQLKSYAHKVQNEKENEELFDSRNSKLTADRAIFLILDELLTKAKLSKNELKQKLSMITINSGPGSFTGLRLGYAFAFALSKSYNIPICRINTFQILAAEMILNHETAANQIWQNKALVLFFAKSYRADYFVMLSNLKSYAYDKTNQAVSKKLTYHQNSLDHLAFDKSIDRSYNQSNDKTTLNNFILNTPQNYAFDKITDSIYYEVLKPDKYNANKQKKIFVIGQDSKRFMDSLPKKLERCFASLEIKTSFNHHLSKLANIEKAYFDVTEPDYLRPADFSIKK